jgi:hypothetical protein
MADDNQRAVAESVFDRAQRREREISEALKLEEVRHAAAIKNMHRLRALRLERDAKTGHEWSDRSMRAREWTARYCPRKHATVSPSPAASARGVGTKLDRVIETTPQVPAE